MRRLEIAQPVEVEKILATAVEQKAFPGGVFALGSSEHTHRVYPFGRLTYEADSSAVATDTLYDLGSLTKVVATTSMAMILVDEGRLEPDRPVAELIPGLDGPAKRRIAVHHLLTHSSGWPAWAPLFEQCQGKAELERKIVAMDLCYEPGTRSLYSDLGFILLGQVLENAAETTIDFFSSHRVFEPLGMRDTLYRPPPRLLQRIAPTEFDARRGRLCHGEVHDENACAMGGVAPHAGLFASAIDLAAFAQMMLRKGVFGGRRVFSEASVERFTRRAGVPGSSRAWGWDTPSAGSSAGMRLSLRSYGHTGFTGTSLWIDPDRDLFVILLTNRVHPTRDNDAIRKIRPAVAEAAVRSLRAV